MAAGFDERAAYKNAVGAAVEGGEFADAVEQENGHVAGNCDRGGAGAVRRARERQLGASHEFAARFVDEFGRGVEALRLARRQDQEGIWIFALQSAEGDERQRLFGGDHAAGHDDGSAASAAGFSFQPIRNGSGRGKFEIVFQVAAGADMLWRARRDNGCARRLSRFASGTNWDRRGCA